MMGGFLILAGIILLGVAALALFGFLDVGLLLNTKYILVFASGLIVVGLLDTLSAVIIARWVD
jgi:hypothetical protein